MNFKFLLIFSQLSFIFLGYGQNASQPRKIPFLEYREEFKAARPSGIKDINTLAGSVSGKCDYASTYNDMDTLELKKWDELSIKVRYNYRPLTLEILNISQTYDSGSRDEAQVKMRVFTADGQPGEIFETLISKSKKSPDFYGDSFLLGRGGARYSDHRVVRIIDSKTWIIESNYQSLDHNALRVFPPISEGTYFKATYGYSKCRF